MNREGKMMPYWGGAPHDSDVCACGVTHSCAGGITALRCNCDKNDNIWREDSGYITYKPDLPITHFCAGDTGRYTHGKNMAYRYVYLPKHGRPCSETYTTYLKSKVCCEQPHLGWTISNRPKYVQTTTTPEVFNRIIFMLPLDRTGPESKQQKYRLTYT